MQRARLILVGIVALIGGGIGAAPLVVALATAKDDASVPAAARAAPRFPVVVRTPEGPPRIATGLTDARGTAITVACATCHTTRPPVDVRDASVLVEFHQGLTFRHGNLACASCHNARDAYSSLHLADGASLEFERVMTLCSQCHGSIVVDWEHGAHGGMNGYWDLTRGGRTRNNCIDCHDPHAPRFPDMVPTFKSFDRFLSDRPKPIHGAHE